MTVNFEVSSVFKKYIGGRSEMILEVAVNSTVEEIACTAGIPVEEIGFATVNGIKVDTGYNIKDGDALKIYPFIIGG